MHGVEVSASVSAKPDAQLAHDVPLPGEYEPALHTSHGDAGSPSVSAVPAGQVMHAVAFSGGAYVPSKHIVQVVEESLSESA